MGDFRASNTIIPYLEVNGLLRASATEATPFSATVS